MALRCPFLTKVPMNLIKTQPASVLKFAECCPFASGKITAAIVAAASRAFSNTVSFDAADGSDGVGKESPSVSKVMNYPGNTSGTNLPKLSSVVKKGANFMHTAVAPNEDLDKFHQVNSTTASGKNENVSLAKSAASQCPFLMKNLEAVTKASDGLQEDVIEIGGQKKKEDPSKSSDAVFDYEEFCKSELDKKKQEGTYRVFPRVDRKAMQFPYARDRMTESDITVWCSNDYLGMSRHPKVMKAVHEAVDRFGVGAGGTRNIGGNSTLHEGLEADLARLHGKERACIFSSCFIANDTALETLGAKLPGCHIFSDAGNHASMIKGIRNSRAPKHVFRHNDPEHLDRLLSEVDKSVPKIVAFETVHSMTGAVCPLKEFLDVSKKHGAITFVDEVHAVGLYGKHGAGIAERDFLMDQVDIFSGTLGKAYGNVGGYVAGSESIIDLVRSFGSGFIFTTSLPPTVLAGAREAVKILSSSEGRALRMKHQETVRTLRNRLVDEGFPVIHCPSHIIPVHVGDPILSTKAMHDFRNRWNIYVQAINYPTVKWGEERLRIAPTPFHDDDMIDYFVRAMKDVWARNSLPLKSMCTISCSFCQEPLKFESLSSREYPCDGSKCCQLRESGRSRGSACRTAG